MKRSLIDRIETRINKTDGCWVWPGAKTTNGYGIITQYQSGGGYKGFTVHRVMYEHYVGPVPAGFDLDHLCRTRACCRPSHLEPVTRQENVRRGAKYRPDSCVKGHDYPENMRIRKNGHAMCVVCDRERQRKYREGKRAKTSVDASS